MKKSFLDRIQAIESHSKERKINDPVTFFDKESSLTMQIIRNGLAVPLPMDEKEWQEMMENQVFNRRKPEVKES